MPEPMTAMSESRPKKHRPTKWQFGIRSRNSPTEALVAIYKALQKMGARWEVPQTKEPGVGDAEESPERSRDDQDDYNSPEYSDSDPGSGTDPEYATHEEQERRRERRRQERGSGEARGRERYGRWNDWGYTVPEDPWVIRARFRKDGMLPAGRPHPTSARSSQVNLSEKRHPAPNMSMTSATSADGSHPPSAVASSENIAAMGPGTLAASRHTNASEESVWVYVTIQLYSIEKDFFLVDFKCAGYERLVRRFVREVMGSDEGDVVKQDLAPDGHVSEDGEYDSDGQELVGAGCPLDEKEITSPFPFLDTASRLIVQLAEQPDP